MMYLNKSTDVSSKYTSDYLDLAKDYEVDPKFDFEVENYDGFNVINDSHFSFGTKAKFADLLVSRTKEDTIVYVAPRTGYAALSLTYLAKKHNKRLILFMPASREASPHQLAAIEHGAEAVFLKTPAMKTLNIWAKKFAEKNLFKYLPFGLDHDLVVAGGVKIVRQFLTKYDIKNLWVATSTGVLIRTLQIALPTTNFHAVCVARNMQQGELGRAKFYSYYKKFLSESSIKTPYDSIRTYDAKAYEYMLKFGNKGDYVWNVAGNISNEILKPTDVNSDRQWADFSDLERF